MTWEDVQSASVIAYPYLWARQSGGGEQEGRKPRPVAVGVRLPRSEGDAVLLFPITSQKPGPDRIAVEIPATEKRRGGLDERLRLWIILDEYNQDIIGRSFYLRPEPAIGRFGRPFFTRVLKLFIAKRSEAHGVATMTAEPSQVTTDVIRHACFALLPHGTLTGGRRRMLPEPRAPRHDGFAPGSIFGRTLSFDVCPSPDLARAGRRATSVPRRPR